MEFSWRKITPPENNDHQWKVLPTAGSAAIEISTGLVVVFGGKGTDKSAIECNFQRVGANNFFKKSTRDEKFSVALPYENIDYLAGALTGNYTLLK